jgi:retron-type reverse transcriptase
MKSQKRKTRNPRSASKTTRHSPIKGVVISKKCSSCGHHEVGIITEAGRFLALKPGMKIAILQEERKD